jgi:hypothetical protein
MTCHDTRLHLGVYVLGAIDPADRARVDQHLATCRPCRDQLAGLAALPALLGRVTEPQLTPPAGDDELLTSLLNRAQAERPRRLPQARRVLVPLAIAGSVAAGTLLGFTLTDHHTTTGALPSVSATTRGPASSPTTTRAAEHLVAADPKTKVRAEIGLWPREGGTSLSIHLTGVPVHTRCHLIAVSRDGARDTAAGWTIEDEAYDDYRGSTMITRPDLDHLEVVTTSGKTLLTIPT